MVCFKELVQPVDHWDAWLVTIVLRKLDAVSIREWELRHTNTLLPTYSQIEEFLLNRCSGVGLSSINCTVNKKVTRSYRTKNNRNANCTKGAFAAIGRGESKSLCCSGLHRLFACSDFKKLPTENPIKLVRASILCFNCL